MNKNRIVKYVLMTSLVLMILAVSSSQITMDGMKNEKNDNTGGLQLLTAAPSAPYHVDNNFSLTEDAYSWCTGSGAPGDPYIIQDLVIDATGYTYGLLIERADRDYFRIENCTVTGATSTGIRIYWCRNATITNNTVYNNERGMELIGSRNVTIYDNNASYNTYGISINGGNSDLLCENNTAMNNDDSGIWCDSSSFIVNNNNASYNGEYGIYSEEGGSETISNNNCTENGIAGIYLYDKDQSPYQYDIESNLCVDNGVFGIYVYDTIGLDLIDNVVIGNKHGVVIEILNSVNIEGNEFIENQFIGLNITDGISVDILDNTAVGNLVGIYTDMLEGSTIDGNTFLNQSGDGSTGILCESGEELTFNKNIINGSDYGIMINNSVDCVANSNKINGTSTAGIYIENNMVPLTIEDNIFTFSAGVVLNRSNWITLDNNSFSHGKSDGIYTVRTNHSLIMNNNITGTTSFEHGIYLGEGENITVIDNRVADNGYYGILLNEMEDCVIENNTINKNYYPNLRIYNSQFINVTHNDLNDTGFSDSLSLSGLTKNILIEWNNISSPASGIRGHGSDLENIYLKFNWINGCRWGIRSSDSFPLLFAIENNTISHCNDEGIRISYATDMVIANNSIYNCSDHGIYLYAPQENVSIVSNEIFNNTNGITTYGGANLTVQDNTLWNHEKTFYFDDCDNMSIDYNFAKNTDVGIELQDCESFNVTYNNFWFIISDGLIETNGLFNRIEHNNFSTPVVSFIADSTEIFEGDSIQFTDTTTGGDAPISYEWDFDDGTPNSTLQNPEHTFSTSGTYDVVLNVTDDSFESVLYSMEIRVFTNDAPEVDCEANITNIVSGMWIEFTDLTSFPGGGNPPFTYEWDFGDGTYSSDQNPIHQYTTTESPGESFLVTLNVTDDAGLSDEDIINIWVQEDTQPNAEFAANTTNCLQGQYIEFTVQNWNGNNPDYQWNFGDSPVNTTGSSQVTHQFNSVGDYTVILTITDLDGDISVYSMEVSCEADSLITDVELHITGFTHEQYYEAIENDDLDFYASITGGNAPYEYDWDFGDGSLNSTDATPSHTYTVPVSAPGYQIQVTIIDQDGDRATATMDYYIEIIEDISPNAYFTTNNTPGQNFYTDMWLSFTDESTPGNGDLDYYWEIDDGVTSTLSTPPNYQFSSPGSYQINLTVTDEDGDSDLFQYGFSVLVDLQPTISFNANASIIYEMEWIKFSSTVTGGNAPLTYHWEVGQAYNPSTENATIRYLYDGEYEINLTVTDKDGDSDFYEMTVNVYNHLRTGTGININATTIEPGDSIQFSLGVYGGVPDLAYQWNFTDGSINSTTSNPIHMFTAEGVYTVVCTVTDSHTDILVLTQQITVEIDEGEDNPPNYTWAIVLGVLGGIGIGFVVVIQTQPQVKEKLMRFIDGLRTREPSEEISEGSSEAADTEISDSAVENAEPEDNIENDLENDPKQDSGAESESGSESGTESDSAAEN